MRCLLVVALALVLAGCSSGHGHSMAWKDGNLEATSLTGAAPPYTPMVRWLTYHQATVGGDVDGGECKSLLSQVLDEHLYPGDGVPEHQSDFLDGCYAQFTDVEAAIRSAGGSGGDR